MIYVFLVQIKFVPCSSNNNTLQRNFMDCSLPEKFTYNRPVFQKIFQPYTYWFHRYRLGFLQNHTKINNGFLFQFGLFFNKLEIQKLVGRLSLFVRTEYHALANASREAEWIHHLLQDFSFLNPRPVTILYDNQSAIYIASTKHIEMDCHLVRDKVHDQTVQL